MDDSIIIISSDEENIPDKPFKTELLNSNNKEDDVYSHFAEKIIETQQSKCKTHPKEVESSFPKKQKLIKTEILNSNGKENAENAENASAEKVIETLQTKRKTEMKEVESSSPLSKKLKLICDENNENNSDGPSADGIVELGNSDSSVLSEFISTCLKLDSSPTMKNILNGKMKRYYSLLNPDYQKSEQFYTLLERKQAEIVRCPSYLYRHLKEVVDELNLHRVDKIKNPSKQNTSDHFIRKLCKAMELLHRKIKKLEEKDVDWDEEDDSSYLQLQRYRERFIKVHNKLQELEGAKKTIFKRKISYSGSKFPTINRAIEKFVNVKGEFPDYQDIVDLLKKSYDSEGIEVTEYELTSQAKSVFENVGDQLQKQRQYECWETHSSFLETDKDPAEESVELHTALEENKMKYGSRIDEVINSFVEKHKKSQLISDDSNSSSGINQTQLETKKDNLNGNVDIDEEKVDDDVKSKERKEKRKNSEREHCTEKDGKGDEHDDGSGDKDDNKEDEEEEEVGKEEDDDDNDDEDDDDNDEDEEEDEDEETNGDESMADILNDLNKEQTIEYTEQLFLYHGPVSPPNQLGDTELNTDSLSPSPSHGFDSSPKTKNGEHDNLIKNSCDEVDNVCIANEDSSQEPTASCSNWKDMDEPIRTCPESPKTNSENKNFLKLKPMSSLLRKADCNEQNEILLD